MDTELFREWFQAFAQNAGITLHIENLYGENNHHIAETCYKGLARALQRGHRARPASGRPSAVDQGNAQGVAGPVQDIVDVANVSVAHAMVTYTVHEPPEPAADRVDRAEELVFVQATAFPGWRRSCRRLALA